MQTRITASQALSHDWFKGAETPSTPLDYSIISRMEEYADWSQTRKLLLNKLAGKLDEEHVRDLRDQFLLVDTDHDGLITIAELEQVQIVFHSQENFAQSLELRPNAFWVALYHCYRVCL